MYAVIVRISQYGMFRRLTLFQSSSISSEQTLYTISALRNFRSPWNRILLEKTIVADLIKKLLAVLYGNRGFYVVKNFDCILSQTNPAHIHFVFKHPIFKPCLMSKGQHSYPKMNPYPSKSVFYKVTSVLWQVKWVISTNWKSLIRLWAQAGTKSKAVIISESTQALLTGPGLSRDAAVQIAQVYTYWLNNPR